MGEERQQDNNDTVYSPETLTREMQEVSNMGSIFRHTLNQPNLCHTPSLIKAFDHFMSAVVKTYKMDMIEKSILLKELEMTKKKASVTQSFFGIMPKRHWKNILWWGIIYGLISTVVDACNFVIAIT